MKVKDIVDLKGCYSAYDVGEKEISVNENIKQRITDIHEKMASYTDAEYRANFLSEVRILLNDLKNN